MLHGMDVLIAPVFGLIGVAVAVGVTYLVERWRWEQQQSTRWDDARRVAYAKFLVNVDHVALYVRVDEEDRSQRDKLAADMQASDAAAFEARLIAGPTVGHLLDMVRTSANESAHRATVRGRNTCRRQAEDSGEVPEGPRVGLSYLAPPLDMYRHWRGRLEVAMREELRMKESRADPIKNGTERWVRLMVWYRRRR